MNFIRRFVLPVAGVAAIALLIVIASPQAVHAVTAALVQIVNTPTNAVPAVQAPAASQIYSSSCSHDVVNTNFGSCSLTQVPAGQTLFVETVSMGTAPFLLPQGPMPRYALLMGAGSARVYVPLLPQAIGQQSWFSGTVGARIPFPAFSMPHCDVSFPIDVTGGYIYCSVFGYLAPAQ